LFSIHGNQSEDFFLSICRTTYCLNVFYSVLHNIIATRTGISGFATLTIHNIAGVIHLLWIWYDLVQVNTCIIRRYDCVRTMKAILASLVFLFKTIIASVLERAF